MTPEGEPHDGPVLTRRVAVAAPLSRRFIAWIADGAVALAPVALAWLATTAGGPRTALMIVGVVAAIGVSIVNDIVLVARTGQSIGRRWLGVQVLDSGAMTPPNAGQVILRNFIGGAGIGLGWHPFFLPAGMMLMISPWPIICYAFAFTDRRWHRGLNDRWAHTVVIDLLAAADDVER